MTGQPDKNEWPPVLTRNISWEEWERGRAYRRSLTDTITGGKVMRRRQGDPRKDAILMRLNNGERGLPFRPLPREK